MAEAEPMSFPDGPRGALDDAIAELISRAERVMGAQGRLRDLLRAVQNVVDEIELPTVLRRIVTVARELVDAEYGALGIIAADGASLDQFVFVGLDDDAAARIGQLPRGHGLLGALITDPRPIRISHMGEDHRAAGVPSHHPEMDSFLGVPIRVRDAVYGNLYLTNSRAGAFSAEDEQLLQALASAAGSAIENARLFEQARTRERWMGAAARLVSGILSAPLDGALDLIVGRVSEVSAAAMVTLVIPGGDGELRIDAVRGPDEERLHGMSFDADASIAGAALSRGQATAISTSDQEPSDPLRCVEDGESGPALAVPLRSRRRSWGVLTVARLPRAPEFTPLELTVLTSLASQASIALELAHARVEQQRALLSDERARIARDLHDHVIQQLFGAGLGLQALAGSVGDAAAADRVTDAVHLIDDAIHQIRTIVFALSSPDTDSLRHRLIDIVAEVSGALPRPPAIRFSGPIDHSVDASLAADVSATTRELLSNAVRHAQAHQISLEIAVRADRIVVTVEDDGCGIRTDRRSGLDNLDRRATMRGGTLRVRSGNDGTRVEWTAPLSADAAVRE
jgi:signal transduction histidine kinase